MKTNDRDRSTRKYAKDLSRTEGLKSQVLPKTALKPSTEQIKMNTQIVASVRFQAACWQTVLQVDGPPAFLDPEATRPLAVNPTHGSAHSIQVSPANAEVEPNRSRKKEKRREVAGAHFDVATLAPAVGTIR